MWSSTDSARSAAIASAIIAAVVLGAQVLPTAEATSRPSTSLTAGLNYVALGDSYAAGFGIAPVADGSFPGCGQSAVNYPHLVASDLRMSLTDVTCGGATTANIITTPKRLSSGTVPLQLEALRPDTDIVTVTIGANDIRLIGTVARCIVLTPARPAQDPASPDSCASEHDAAAGTTNPIDGIATVIAPNLSNTLTAIKSAAPDAKVFVVGYVSIVPDAANTPATGCFTAAVGARGQPEFTDNAFPFATAAVIYLHAFQVALEAAIEAEADRAGATYVPVFAETESHSACAPAADSFMNGITLTGIDPVAFAAKTLHPNAAANRYIAELLGRDIAAAVSADPRAGLHTSAARTAPAPGIPMEAVGGLVIGALVFLTASATWFWRRAGNRSAKKGGS